MDVDTRGDSEFASSTMELEVPLVTGDAKGKTDSWNTTCLEVYNFPVGKWRHRYTLWFVE